MPRQLQHPSDTHRKPQRGYAPVLCQATTLLSTSEKTLGEDISTEYKKWQEANAKNDRNDVDKHARKMEVIMARYKIPVDTPFDAVATSNEYSRHYDVREFQGRFSLDDQKKFDKAYEHWVNDRSKRDRDDIAKDEGKMLEIMTRYNIPRDVPYDVLASGAQGY